jgi:hypothetical protein
MLASTEPKSVGQSPEVLGEKNVPSKSPNDEPKEGIDKHGTFAAERVNVFSREGATSDHDSNNSSTNIFSDPEVAAHYVSVYDKAHYECRHVFDPKLDWTKEEEKTVIRKLDWHGRFPSKSKE